MSRSAKAVFSTNFFFLFCFYINFFPQRFLSLTAPGQLSITIFRYTRVHFFRHILYRNIAPFRNKTLVTSVTWRGKDARYTLKTKLLVSNSLIFKQGFVIVLSRILIHFEEELVMHKKIGF
jgi:hypothetical protein